MSCLPQQFYLYSQFSKTILLSNRTFLLKEESAGADEAPSKSERPSAAVSLSLSLPLQTSARLSKYHRLWPVGTYIYSSASLGPKYYIAFFSSSRTSSQIANRPKAKATLFFGSTDQKPTSKKRLEFGVSTIDPMPRGHVPTDEWLIERIQYRVLPERSVVRDI